MPRKSLNKFEIVQQGEDVAIIGVGDFFQMGESIANILFSEYGIKATVINPRYLTGVDEEILRNLSQNHKEVVTLEDGIVSGGYGSKISQFYALSEMKVINCGFKDNIPTHYNANELMIQNELSEEAIVEKITRELEI